MGTGSYLKVQLRVPYSFPLGEGEGGGGGERRHHESQLHIFQHLSKLAPKRQLPHADAVSI